MRPLEIAKPLLQPIADASDEIEQARRLPQHLADQMAEAGLFRMVVPEVYGGLQSHPGDYIETLAAVAEADGSAGWNLMIGTTTSLLSSNISPDWAAHIYGKQPNVITVGVTAPIGKAVKDVQDGQSGLRVTGRWPFGSGCQMAQWICGGCLLHEDDKPVMNAQGLPEPLMVFFEATDVTIHDTWDTSGLRGTGSHDIEVRDQFVPDGRWVVLGSRPNVDAPLYHFPTFGLLALGVSAVSLGIAHRAVTEFKALAGDKTPTGATRSLANRASAQKDVALAEARLKSALAFTRESIEDCYERAVAGQPQGLERKANLRLAAANNAWSAIDVVDRLYHAAGGSSIYRKNKLQQCFRDVHVPTQHIMVGQAIYEVVGKVLLGVDPRQPL